MKTSFTKKLSFLFLFSILLNSSLLLKAQILEEIPNPAPLTLDFYSGGENGDLFFNYIDVNFNGTLHHYGGDDLTPITLPPTTLFSFFSHQYNGNSYIQAFDGAFNAELYEFDGTSTNLVNLPPGLTFGFYLTNYNDKMIIALNDATFNTFLYQYDGTDLVEMPSPVDLQFNNFLVTYNSVMYLSYFDPINFTSKLFTFDGFSLDEVPNVPPDANFINLSFEGENNLYMNVQDATFNNTLYVYDGVVFTEIPNPPGMLFSFVVGENTTTNEVYLSYFDNITFINTLFLFDALGTLSEITSPPGFDFPNLSNIYDGTTYFNYFETVNFTSALFRFENGLLDQVEGPAGSQFSFYADTLGNEAYFIFNDAAFNQIVTKLDPGTNTTIEIPAPAGFTFSQYTTSVNDKMFLVYNDPTFERSLWIFDGQNFVQVQNPDNQTFGNFMVEDEGKIYLRYNDPNFNGTLYVLTPNSFPTSIDASISTFVNIPYFFSSDDFTFADNDPNDLFTNILITGIEQVGYLLWNGAHVYEGDIIPIDEIADITFTPLTDELGSPYDAFQFKVGDGQAFSETSYTMTINVLDPTSVTDNELNAFASLFPVPANVSTTLKVLTSDKVLDEMTVRIFATSGQLVFQKSYTGLGNVFQETIDVSNLAVGSYFLVGQSPAGRLVKQIQVNR